MNYEIVCGIETHIELATKTKIFCGCTTEFGGEPNTHCCPVCTGQPGALPILNQKVVEYAIKAGLALNWQNQYQIPYGPEELCISRLAQSLPDLAV